MMNNLASFIIRQQKSGSTAVGRGLKEVKLGPIRALHVSVISYNKSPFASLDTFLRRHIGPSDKDIQEKMLPATGFKSLDDLIDATVPEKIRIKKMSVSGGDKGEAEMLEEFKQLMSKNKVYKTFIGAGYYNTHTPLVILRNIIENPLWYTPYTPYQAEISQGRLEMLLNYQTMVADLTKMDISNASLLDEATAAAEAMALCVNIRAKKEQNVFLISSDVHPQTIAVVKTRAKPLGITVRKAHHSTFDFKAGDVCGILLQYPATSGRVEDLKALTIKLMEQVLTLLSLLISLLLLCSPLLVNGVLM